jgi:hypothetical protein
MTFLSNGGEFVPHHIQSQHARKYITQSFHSDQMHDIPCTHHTENLKLHNNVISPTTTLFRLNYMDTDTAQVGLLQWVNVKLIHASITGDHHLNIL